MTYQLTPDDLNMIDFACKDVAKAELDAVALIHQKSLASAVSEREDLLKTLVGLERTIAMRTECLRRLAVTA